MGKIKVYELAKELNIENKELIEIAEKNGIEVKSHLSAIDEVGVEKIKKSMNKNKSQKQNESKSVENKKASKSKEEPKKKEEVKTTGQVIIRREVIVSEEEPKSNQPVKTNKADIGFSERRNKNYNIVYREKPTKPMTVSELFGIKPKEPPKKEVTKNEQLKTPVKNEEVVDKKETTTEANRKGDRINNYNSGNNTNVRSGNTYNSKNIGNRNDNGNRNGSYNNFNRNNTGNNGFNKNNNRFARNEGFNKNDNSNGFKKKEFGDKNVNGNREFNNRNNNRGRHSLDRDIDNIVQTEYIEKDNQRDYSTKIIDKQKANRNFEDKKKATKSRKFSGEENFDEDKLRDLKQVNKLSNMFEDQEGGMLDYYDLTTERGKKNKKRDKKAGNRVKQKIFELKEITIPSNISVKDLATELKKTSSDVLKKLIELGIMANINQDLDFDTAYLIADSFGVTAIKKEEVKDEDILFDDSEDKEEDLQPRPPVVVVMGHVDHGKTSLLDAVRQTNVIEGEAGGITQHIGAYKVTINGREITFLDTPGHEAFTSMRARGAQITDVAILVVAADDGVMPQTIEAINHAKAAEIPIIVAINKIDLPGANAEKVKQELMKYELIPEEWGGDTIFVPISAKKNINIDTLLEMVLLVADMQNLKANPDRQSKGTVIEARLDKNQGPIASVLVQRGTLNVGDTIILGSSIGKIRTMKNDKGRSVKLAGPSTPVEITGLHDVPAAGDIFYEVKNEKVAKHLIERRKLEEREKAIANNNMVTLDNLFEKMASDELKQLNVIVKADVQGTAQALKSSLEKLSNEEVRVKVLHSNAGGVTESDVELAKAANAIVIAFNVRPVGAAQKLSEKEGIEIKQYSVIYQALEDVEDAMKGMLAPQYREVNIGSAEVRQTFKVSNVGTIAGCYVTDGKLERNAGVRVIRDGVVIHDGKLISLKRFKDDAKEVSKGFECGMQLEDFDDIKEGDTIEAYIKEEIKR